MGRAALVTERWVQNETHWVEAFCVPSASQSKHRSLIIRTRDKQTGSAWRDKKFFFVPFIFPSHQHSPKHTHLLISPSTYSMKSHIILIALLFTVGSVHSFSPSPRANHQCISIISTPRQATPSADEDARKEDKPERKHPDILLPFAPAADPNYINVGPVGEGDFIVSRTGGPTDEELTNENIRRIVDIECTDLEVNTLIWKCLGYRFDEESQTWKNDEVFPNWRNNYPTPPDLVGMRRIYEKEIDQPTLRANQALVRSVPVEHKLSLKKHLRPMGWKGYQYSELTPNKTRRAQCANWIVFFREELYGRSVEELRARRAAKKAAEEKAKQEGEAEEWKPPVREVY